MEPLGLSVDSLEDHNGWKGDIEETQGTALNFPLIADPKREVADLYDGRRRGDAWCRRDVGYATGHRLGRRRWRPNGGRGWICGYEHRRRQRLVVGARC